jgi:RNA polymerase sigma-70 factor (ECF subfamily)
VAGLTNIAELDSLADLLLATARGDRRAFARLYQLSASRLFPIALRILRQRGAAEEALQEGFLSIWRKAGHYRPDRGRALPWMATIVRHCAIDRLRVQSREPPTVTEWGDPAMPEAVPDHLARTVRGCLDRLSENYRRCILLVYYYGMTHEELARHLRAPLGTVKSWMRRGLLQLRVCVEQ